jgi:hypothetical protein
MVSMSVAEMPFARKVIAAAVLAAGVALPGLVAAAERHGDLAATGFGSANLFARGSLQKSNFGIRLLSISGPENFDEVEAVEDATSDVLRLYGDMPVPAAAVTTPDSLENRRPFANTFGVSWQHRLNARDSLSVAAEYGTGATAAHARSEVTDARTADARTGVSWTSSWGGEFRPSLTGSLFVGDESAREETSRYLDRRYVGLSVGGQLNLFRDHTPYVAFQYRRSYYDMGLPGETLPLGPHMDDRSLLSAGWRWQVQPSMSLEAGASFGLNSSGQDLYSTERSRLFFGTRYDFQ